MPMDATILGAWVAVGLTLSLYTFLYKDNPFFKFTEHLYLGISLGYFVILTYYQFLLPKLLLPMVGEQAWPESSGARVAALPGRLYDSLVIDQNWPVLIPALLGLLLLSRFVPSIAWLSRWTFAFVVGFTAGAQIPRTISQNVLIQIEETLKPAFSVSLSGGIRFTWTDLWFLLIVVGVLCTLVHFYYSVEHRGPIRGAARIGVVFLMISFGASFGYTAMARMSLLYGRTKDLIEYSGARYAYATPIVLAVVVGGLIVWELNRREQSPPGR